MPLENFYQESDHTAQRRLDRIALAFIATAAYLIFGWVFLNNYLDRQTDRREEAVRTANAHALCDGLPKPESFVFVRRDPPVSYANAASVTYYYKSAGTHDEIMLAFRRSLDSKSWKRLDNKNGFTNADQTILINRAHDDADYYLLCYQETISFGIH